MVLNEEQWIKELREKRIAYGISQGKLAVASGITREYLNKIESGKMKPSKELLNTLHKELARFNPEAPLTMLFDYVKIRFPTLDIQHIIKDILKLNINYMLHEDYGRYSYTEHYSLGDIFIYTSADEEKGVLLELKGRGCRQFESYLLAQQRSWYDFLMDALVDGGVMKRIDLAAGETLVVDTDRMTAYVEDADGMILRNALPYLEELNFPTLAVGSNTVSVTAANATFTGLEIQARSRWR